MKLLILSLFVLISCNPKAPEITESDALPKGHPVPKEQVQNQFLATAYSSRSFDEMIQIYAKATGVHSSRSGIRNEIAKIRAQLPLNNDPTSYNAFNQIALTALSIQFCNMFVADNTVGSAVFGITTTDPQWTEKISNILIERLALSTIEEDPFLLKIKDEMKFTMADRSSTAALSSWNLSKAVTMGCSVILASSYYTFD